MRRAPVPISVRNPFTSSTPASSSSTGGNVQFEDVAIGDLVPNVKLVFTFSAQMPSGAILRCWPSFHSATTKDQFGVDQVVTLGQTDAMGLGLHWNLDPASSGVSKVRLQADSPSLEPNTTRPFHARFLVPGVYAYRMFSDIQYGWSQSARNHRITSSAQVEITEMSRSKSASYVVDRTNSRFTSFVPKFKTTISDVTWISGLKGITPYVTLRDSDPIFSDMIDKWWNFYGYIEIYRVI
jgi:hypothetical protein